MSDVETLWHPRDTAPRDGSWIVVQVDEEVVPVQWIENRDHPEGGYFGLGETEQDFWTCWRPAQSS